MFANEPEIAKKWANEYKKGGVASMFRKKLADGNLDPEIIAQIQSMAATGADASTISSLVGVSEEQVNNILSSGDTSSLPIQETEETVETAEVTEEADPLLNLFQQNDSLNNDQSMTTLFNTAENPVNANMTGEPTGIMTAATGGRATFEPGGMAGAHGMGAGVGADGKTDGQRSSGDSGPSYSPHTDTLEQIAGQKEIDIQNDIDQRNEEKYDNPLDRYYGKTRVTKDLELRTERFETKKKEIEDKFKNKLRNKGLTSILTQSLDFGISDIFGALKDTYDLTQNKNEFENDLKELRADFKDLGIPDFSPHTDTPIQSIDQTLADLNQPKDREGPDEPDGIQPYISPITLEVDEDFAQGENIDYNMQSALDKIRANQARRSGSIATGNIQDNEIMSANKGGLAGLFKVKN